MSRARPDSAPASTLRQIAARLGVSNGTVATDLRRGLAKLRAVLVAPLPELPPDPLEALRPEAQREAKRAAHRAWYQRQPVVAVLCAPKDAP